MNALGSLLGPDVRELIAEQRWDALRLTLAGFDPGDVAELTADFDTRSLVAVFRIVPRDQAGRVFAHYPQAVQESLLRSLADADAQSLIRAMTPDDQAALIDELPAEVTRRLLDALPPAELHAARALLGYPPDTAGRFMTPRYVALEPTMTAGQALEHLRRVGRSAEQLDLLYIVDGGLIRGELALANLILCEPQQLIAELAEATLVSVPATTTRGELVRIFAKYDRAALPVTDDAGKLLGIITADDVLDAAVEQATEAIQRAGGTEALEAPYFDVGFRAMMRKRGGWLSVLFLGEMLTASAMAWFEEELAKAVVLAMFIPLIISSGGNSGSQAATIIVRSLALGEMRLRDWWRVLLRELRTGLALGSWLGLLGIIRILIWHHAGFYDYGAHAMLVGCTIWATLIGVVLFGSVSGSMLPFVLKSLGFDPAVSSAPFVATLVDVTGLVIYFTVAALILSGTLL